jgi:hypothetical protein
LVSPSWRRARVEPERNPLERAVELFDLGIALRAQLGDRAG